MRRRRAAVDIVIFRAVLFNILFDYLSIIISHEDIIQVLALVHTHVVVNLGLLESVLLMVVVDHVFVDLHDLFSPLVEIQERIGRALLQFRFPLFLLVFCLFLLHMIQILYLMIPL